MLDSVLLLVGVGLGAFTGRCWLGCMITIGDWVVGCCRFWVRLRFVWCLMCCLDLCVFRLVFWFGFIRFYVPAVLCFAWVAIVAANLSWIVAVYLVDSWTVDLV